jgi:hypothetical protein
MTDVTECTERAALLAELASVIAIIVDLNHRQLAAARAGDVAKLHMVAVDLRREQRRKTEVLYSYLNHVREHQC